jgi:DNA (cytosine-5)-methyltransferase 1
MLRGLVIDNFAGGGGASTGIEAALGRSIDVAINHDAEAVAMHQANHPGTCHHCQSVWKADPRDVVAEAGGGPVALAWFSPDCKHFSKAKGGKPVQKNIRDLAWVVVQWARRVRPAVIMLENVEEFRTWAPLGADGRPINPRDPKPEPLSLALEAPAEAAPKPRKREPKANGETFDLWIAALRKLGYRVEDRELRACDYGAPTSRKRLFLIARCDGQPIVWPEPTHGKPGSPEVVSGRRLPWRTAAEIIDWSIPCPSIFERKRELKDATKRRIAHGIMRFVVNNPRPFIVPLCHTQGGNNAQPGDEPLRTITTAKGGEMAIVAPVFARTAHGEVDSKGKRRGKGDHGPEESFPTILASNDSALVAARLVSPTFVGCGGRRGQSGPVDPEGPYPTTTAKGDACLITAALISNQYTSNTNGGRADPLRPFKTITSGGGHHALVALTLIQTAHGYHDKKGPRARRGTVNAQQPLPTTLGSGSVAALAVHLVSVDNTSTRAGRYFPAEDPLRTVTSSGGGFAAVSATLIQCGYGERKGQSPRILDLALPLGTVVGGGGKHALVAAFLAQHNGGKVGRPTPVPLSTITATGRQQQVVCAHIEQANTGMVGHPPEKPLSTIVGKGCTQRIIASSVMKLRGTSRDGQPADEPLHTISAGGGKGGVHFAEVSAFLVKYYGAHQHGQAADKPLDSVTSKARFGLVTVTIDGEEYVIADIGMRMLTPRELARAQGFPDSYILDPVVNGKPMTKTAQIRMIGNSVCPPMAEALVRANLAEAEPREAVAA